MLVFTWGLKESEKFLHSFRTTARSHWRLKPEFFATTSTKSVKNQNPLLHLP